MATINVYLRFNGNCEATFHFYKSVFGGEFPYIARLKDMPDSDKLIPDSEKDKIMHISLPISKETLLLGCDTSEAMSGQSFVQGNNFSICITPHSVEERINKINTLT